MTLDQHKKLFDIIFLCYCCDRGSKDDDLYELSKREIEELNLTPDEYEYATTKIARIIGL